MRPQVIVPPCAARGSVGLRRSSVPPGEGDGLLVRRTQEKCNRCERAWLAARAPGRRATAADIRGRETELAHARLGQVELDPARCRSRATMISLRLDPAGPPGEWPASSTPEHPHSSVPAHSIQGTCLFIDQEIFACFRTGNIQNSMPSQGDMSPVTSLLESHVARPRAGPTKSSRVLGHDVGYPSLALQKLLLAAAVHQARPARPARPLQRGVSTLGSRAGHACCTKPRRRRNRATHECEDNHEATSRSSRTQEAPVRTQQRDHPVTGS